MEFEVRNPRQARLILLGLGIAVGLSALIIPSCEQDNRPIKEIVKAHILEDMQEIEYDGCEYLLIGDGPNRVFTHKGNCENTDHYGTRDLVR